MHLVVGLGRSGQAVVKQCQARGLDFVTYDDHLAADFSSASIGAIPWLQVSCVVVSPGVPSQHAVVVAAEQNNREVLSEIEFALRLCSAKMTILAVTGTNGKTTTVHLLQSLLLQCGFRSHLLGNVGEPLSEHIQNIQDDDYLVLELSSYQLDHIRSLHARAVVVLNVTPDHLDRYDSFMDYCQSKMRITQNQTQADICILPANDPLLALWLQGQPRLQYVSAFGSNEDQLFSDQTMIYKEGQPWFAWKDCALVGVHNQANVMTVLHLLCDLGVDFDCVAEGLRAFVPLDHRLEMVRTVNGVTFINDSKATNVDAVFRALDTVCGSIVLILGGLPKGDSVTIILDSLKACVRQVIVYGEAAKRLSAQQLSNVVAVSTLEKAVQEAFACSESGDTVLLSPGCSSLDLHKNYQERGHVFKREVLSL